MCAKRWVLIPLAAVWLITVPVLASAQESGIAGVVKDTSGSVIPGVTVEASSPALIEKVRSVVTDTQGQYKIINLLPGTYTVTFSLTGFATVRRDGITLTADFTANVNADLRVGSIEETINVSGQSAVVDVQNVVQQRVMTADVIEAIPTGRLGATLGEIIPGMTATSSRSASAQDVGGLNGDNQQSLAIHGGRFADMNIQVDSLPTSALNGVQFGGITIDVGSIQEFNYEVGAISTELPNGGIMFNQILKEGGNDFKGFFFVSGSNGNLQNGNLDANLMARGLASVGALQKMWDLNPSMGGAIVQDKLWFFASGRYWGQDQTTAGMYFAKDAQAFIYAPDMSRQAYTNNWFTSYSLRPTWKATEKNKFLFWLVNQNHRCACYTIDSNFATPEAAFQNKAPVDNIINGTWTNPVSNHLLLEAGATHNRFDNPRLPEPGSTGLSVTESSTGLISRSAKSYNETNATVLAVRAALNYVTGSHAAKVGVTFKEGKRLSYLNVNGQVNLIALNGVPKSLMEYATPYVSQANLDAALGIFVQDVWTLRRLTLNLGLRYDHQAESDPAQNVPATLFVPARSYPAMDGVLNWNDLSPRFGAVYNLFGTGKTALKVTVNKYLAAESIEVANALNPVLASVNSVTRTWSDPSGTYNPFLDCDLTNPNANGGCGAISNKAFGSPNIVTHYDPAVISGWGKRGYNWETTVGVQQELLPNVALNATYFRRAYGNFTATVNQAVTPSNFSPYCVTAPADSRLAGGGGNSICGLYDVNPPQFGLVNSLITFASNYGDQWEHYNGVDVTVNARLSHGGIVQGGLNIGRDETNNCAVVLTNPQITNSDPFNTAATLARTQAYCDIKPPFQLQVKLSGSYPLPWWDVRAAAVFQTAPGPLVLGTQTVLNAQIAPSLGRNLSAGAGGTVAVDLVPPGTLYGERLYQLDARLTKTLRLGSKARVQGNFDAYNVLNANTILIQNNVYGPSWQNAQIILPGRLFKFSAQLNF